jgi:hypothetical protein
MKKSILFFVICFIVFNIFSQTIASIQWQKSFGGTSYDYGSCHQQTSDGGYVFIGYTRSQNGDITINHSNSYDIWVVKMNSNGNLVWQKCLGGTSDEFSGAIKQTSDGGYIICGSTTSNNGDVTGNHGGENPINGNSSNDSWVVKLNSVGIIQWQKCHGGTGDDGATDINQTSDGGYIVCGYTNSNNGDVSGNHGGTNPNDGSDEFDSWVLKLNSLGVIQWQKCYGGSSRELARKIIQNPNGGYIVSGWTNSSDGDITLNHGNEDVWVLKISDLGVIQWQKCYGGFANDEANDIKLTTDGGYIFTGMAGSNDGDISGFHGYFDFWVVKIDALGNLIWQKCFGGTEDDRCNSIIQTNDGGFILSGYTNSIDGDIITSYGNQDAWVVKINISGDLQWQKCFGGTNNVDVLNYTLQTNDGGFVMSGTSNSIDFDAIGNHGFNDLWIFKLFECNATTNSFSTLNVSSCNAYTTPLGQLLTNSGTFTEIIPNHLGCDSTITINFTKFQPTSNNITVQRCLLPYVWNGQSYNTYGNYTQVLQTVHGCDSTVNLTLNYLPITNQNICIVGVNPASGKNKVVWEKEQTAFISNYNIYRENTQSGSFDLIGATNYTDSSVFEDLLSYTNQQAYRYQIKYVDTCGNEGSAGDTHKTLHLTINQGVGSTWNLIWTSYEGISFPSYNIYRGTNSSNMTLINTVASNITSYTDNNAPSGFVYYQIEILGPNCTPTKSPYNNSKSNISTNYPSYLGINENLNNQISIAPNPTTYLTTLTVSQEFIGKSFSITDFAGRIVLQGKIQSMNQTIDLQKVARGSYFLTVENTNLLGFKIIKE